MEQPSPSAKSANAYDLMPYLDLSYVTTHPDRLTTIARLFGLQPAPVTSCRVLEIGCASGGNLLPMAYQLPAAEFVGLDYSARQIEEGEQRIAALGLANVRLVCADLADAHAGKSLGDFDFVIAHGVYSWTAPPVRDAMLALCKQVLRPHGVAYVSYNTYPGWHAMGVVRDAMLYHSRHATTPQQKAKQGRAMAAFLAEHATDGLLKEVFRHYVSTLEDGLKGTSDSFLLHDEMEEVNDPVYFHQFVEHISAHDLQYLVEIDFRTMLPSAFNAETQTALQAMANDAIEWEQKMDFLANRMFRQSLLCHADRPVQRRLSPQAVMGSWLRSQAKRVASPSAPLRPGVVQFAGKGEATLSTDHPLSIAALEVLAAVWPRALDFAELVAAARARMGASHEGSSGADLSEEMALASTLLRAHAQSVHLVDLHSYQPQVTSGVNVRPVASAMARYEALTRTVVTNMWHERVTLLPVQQRILRCLNGEHTVAQVADLLDGEITAAEAEEHLRFFAYAALLVK